MSESTGKRSREGDALQQASARRRTCEDEPVTESHGHNVDKKTISQTSVDEVIHIASQCSIESDDEASVEPVISSFLDSDSEDEATGYSDSDSDSDDERYSQRSSSSSSSSSSASSSASSSSSSSCSVKSEASKASVSAEEAGKPASQESGFEDNDDGEEAAIRQEDRRQGHVFDKDVIVNAESLHSQEDVDHRREECEVVCPECKVNSVVGVGDNCVECGHIFEITKDGFIKDDFIATDDS